MHEEAVVLSFVVVGIAKFCGDPSVTVVAEGGFKPPTFGLWAQYAPTATLCCNTAAVTVTSAMSTTQVRLIKKDKQAGH